MFVTGMYVSVDIGLRLVPPHEAEMVLSDYKRVTGMFVPSSVKITWTQLSGGEELWANAEVSGRRTIKRGARATVKYEEAEDGMLDHWPAYMREAWTLARDQVKR